MWLGNVPLHLTQEQLHHLFRDQEGFLSVSNVKKRTGANSENDPVERGWALVT